MERAGAVIEEVGSADAFARRLARSRTPLRRLGPVLGLALEIAPNDAAEREELARETRRLEETWRIEDEIARIVDEL